MASIDPIERLSRTLVWIETHLDGDLSLETLAHREGLSPHHFHRLFRGGVGETTKQYVQRLRLERAAHLLAVEDRTILDVALDVGFRSHETFTRAFRRHFGATPRAYRSRWRSDATAGGGSRRPGIEARRPTGELSPTRVRRLREIPVAFIRHLGAYEAVPPGLWEELLDWTARTGRDAERLLLGIGHDAPSITPVEKLRFDACVRVPEPFAPEGRIGCQTIPGGTYAMTIHAGPFETLSAAWAEVFGRAQGIRGYRTAGLPALEIYQATRINPQLVLNRTDLYLPLVEI